MSKLRRKLIPMKRDFPPPKTSADYAHMSRVYGDAAILCGKISIGLAVVAICFSVASLVIS